MLCQRPQPAESIQGISLLPSSLPIPQQPKGTQKLFPILITSQALGSVLDKKQAGAPCPQFLQQLTVLLPKSGKS